MKTGDRIEILPNSQTPEELWGKTGYIFRCSDIDVENDLYMTVRLDESYKITINQERTKYRLLKPSQIKVL